MKKQLAWSSLMIFALLVSGTALGTERKVPVRATAEGKTAICEDGWLGIKLCGGRLEKPAQEAALSNAMEKLSEECDRYPGAKLSIEPVKTSILGCAQTSSTDYSCTISARAVCLVPRAESTAIERMRKQMFEEIQQDQSAMETQEDSSAESLK